MKKLLILAILLGGLLIAGPSLAAEYYIDAQNGADGDAGTEAAPWQSLSKINAVSGGDTVYLKGEFTGLGGPITIGSAISGTASNPTKVMNWPNQTVTIQIFASNYVLINNASNIEFSGLEFHNNGTIISNSGGINMTSGIQNVSIFDNIFRDSRHPIRSDGMAVSLVNGVNIYNNLIFNNLFGIYLIYAENVEIYGNNIYDNIGGGIINSGGNTHNIYNNVIRSCGEIGAGGISVTNLRIVNNTIYSNLFGVFGSSVAGLVVKNNILSNNTHAGVGHTSSTNLAFDYNLFHDNANVGNVGGGGVGGTYHKTLAGWQALGFDEHSLEGDPHFVSTTAGSEDFDITADSDAIDAGLDTSGFTTTDYNGAPRSQGTAYDIGAYEFATIPTLAVTSTKPRKLQFDWDDTCTGCTYEILRSVKSDFSTSKTYSNITSSEKLIKNLKASKKYYWKIKSNNGVNKSSYADALFSPTRPLKVKKLEITEDVTSNIAKIRWKKYKRVKRYSIKVMNSAGKKIKVVKIKRKKKFLTNKKKTFVTKTLKNLKPGKKYRVKVWARRKMGGTWYKGRWSQRRHFVTPIQ